MHSAALEKYYRGKIVPEGEWEAFVNCMRSPLPLSLRINVSVPGAAEVADFVFNELSHVFSTERLKFFPRSLGMQSDASRGELKRNVAHKRIKKIVAALNEGGFLTRQETVSMIPPLLLDVQPGHRVLDMCSAPGSKTSQILEAIVASHDSGCVVANDLNSSRLDVLNHQTNRCATAQSHLIITNYDAMTYPLMSDAAQKFDRVLCDVMCSGDGTLRKSMDLWARWNAVQGADLHACQIRVLTRGMQLCKKGGIVVYSTCSLNPIEDEAVLSECLAKAGGSFRLIDPTPFLPGLQGERGVFDWVLTTKDLDAELHTYEEAVAYRESKGGKGFQYRPSMFANPDRLREQNMQHAIRVFPHRQNTGGFFIAALECVTDYPDSVRPPPTALAEKPFKPLSDELKATVQKALALPDAFPYDNLYLRNEGAREQKIYYVNDAVKATLPALQATIAQMGAKVFEGYVKHCNDKLRFCAEGAGSLAPLLPPSFFVPVTADVILALVGNGMDTAVFCAKAHITVDQLPSHSFIMTTGLPFGLGTLRVSADRMGSVVVSKVLEWQQVLCKLALGRGIVDDTTEAPEAASDNDADEINDVAQ